jgi:hypothetical protein
MMILVAHFRENFGTNSDHARNSLTNCGIRQPEYGDRRIHYMNTRKRGEAPCWWGQRLVGRETCYCRVSTPCITIASLVPCGQVKGSKNAPEFWWGISLWNKKLTRLWSSVLWHYKTYPENGGTKYHTIGIVGLKRGGPCAETTFSLSEKRTSPFESAGGVSLVRL